MRRDICNEWSEEAETICSECLSVMLSDQREAARHDVLEDTVMLVDDLAASLRLQLKLHEKEWRSNDTQKPADEDAKKVLERAEEWLQDR